MTRQIAFDDRSRQQTHFSTCYMCACRCGIKVTVENDRVRFIQGNPNHPVNKGVLCAKGSAGIMKQYSAAKLTKPLMRRPGAERGAGGLRRDRVGRGARHPDRAPRDRSAATDPTKLAFFTGRDQMQALSGLWAQQFGTPNWAAHGGFCSVNMAVAGLYTIGYSFWEFGAPDWDHAKYFMLWGVAEDHSSNPIKIGLDKLKRRGAKFVSINPVRTGYSAIADEWLPIRPGTDGLLALAIVHVLLKRGAIDWEFLIRYTNAPWLVVQTPGMPGDGLFARDAERQSAGLGPCRAGARQRPSARHRAGAVRERRAARRPPRQDGVLADHASAISDERYAPETVAAECGIDAATITRIAHEMAHVAFNEAVELPIRVDRHARAHARQGRRPAGRDARDARHLRALQRFPDLPRAAPVADAARRARRTGQLPRPRAVSAAHPDAHAAGERSDGDLRAGHAAEAHAQRQSRRGPRTWSSTRTASRCASTRRTRGSRRSRRTA